ncbi:hypothetical protein DEFDS_0751 [Deferribacter desulfuricans SSM1]|uniref:histidine kinase n=1 Tax=Deferribacter desulfuricans (strain DSM 14783 / JCM 11476 / NBRC 101012 / SSM1) TaxID=639282 RepID=D3PCA7_DEFDS|nr:HAMP domain-containing sensor histidine kinase [Deferribacter desulfuricans]BAI80230.1 hypothetical protein DEFDS_0751 [Deferribacter desulfuricans SSM1]
MKIIPKEKFENIKQKFFNLSLTQKFLISSVAVIFLVLVLLNLFIYLDFKNFFISVERKNFEKRFKKSLISATSYYVFRNDWDNSLDFSPIFNILNNEPNLIEAIIYSSDGKRLAVMKERKILNLENKSEGLLKALKGEISYEIKKAGESESFNYLHIVDKENVIQEIYYPVIFDGKVKGVVEIYKDVTEVFNNIRTVRFRATVFSIFGFILYIILIFFIVKKIENKEKQLKDKVAHYEKLSILGQFASKMAHEIGTPMHVIMGNVELILDECEENNFVKKRGENIARQINKIQNIIRNYLYVSKKPVPVYEPVNLKELVSDIVEDMSFTISDNIELRTNVDEVTIFTDKGFVEQILYNFVKNSADSIGENKGFIEIKSVIDGEYIKLLVVDNGKGIDEKIKEKIFNPFFSTKKTGKGTGLGLAVCKELVESLGGQIFCESKDGETIFGIELHLKVKNA